MAEKYLNRNDLILRLDRTICLYDGVPYFVSARSDETGDKVALYRLTGELRNKATKIVDHTEDAFEDRSVPLGYFQSLDTAYYLQRIASRTQNQGLRQNVISGVPDTPRRDYSWFTSTQMEACILGKHTTVADALEKIASGYNSVVVHRHVAIGLVDRKRIALYYKGKLCALRKGNGFEWLEGDEMSVIKKVVNKLGVL